MRHTDKNEETVIDRETERNIKSKRLALNLGN